LLQHITVSSIDIARVDRKRNLVVTHCEFSGNVEITAELIERPGCHRTVRLTFTDACVGIRKESISTLSLPVLPTTSHITRALGGANLLLTISGMPGGSIQIDRQSGNELTAILTLPLSVADAADRINADPVDTTNAHSLYEWRTTTAAALVDCPDEEAESLSGFANPAVLPAIFHDIIRQYRLTNDQNAASLERAVQLGDFAHIVEISHRMKDASEMLGAKEFANVCERIGHAGGANDVEAVKAHMATWCIDRDRLKTYVDGLHATLVDEPLARLTRKTQNKNGFRT
jgi:HPt (histidine-containing phosphotransfer) domain-containing protein